jgi:hypothetical protein
MERCITTELLDELPAEDSRAIRSRRDLRRLNGMMGNAPVIADTLRNNFPPRKPFCIAEIGAGDGEFLLRVARRLRRSGNVEATLVDQQKLLAPETQKQFAQSGWRVEAIKRDVFDWLGESANTDAMLANLFLHHFSDEQLRRLFREASGKTRLFIATEPCRAAWPLFCSRWLGLIGCGPVTCHDAPVSVRAGFRDRELSSLWPAEKNWELIERRAGLFSHLFVARKKTEA